MTTLLVSSVVAFAVTSDNAGGTAVTAGSSHGTGELQPYDDVAEESTTSTTPSTLPPTPTVPDLAEVKPADPKLQPPVSVTVPTLPKLAAPPRPKPKPVPTPATPAPSGSDCGTPSGYGGYGALRTKTAGPDNATKITIEIYPCHQYDGSNLQHTVHFDDPNAVLIEVDTAYGDGTVRDAQPWSGRCDDTKRPNPQYYGSGVHAYAQPGTYTVTSTVRWGSCKNLADPSQPYGETYTATIEIPVFRHAGPHPR